jgi:hypothetical protein
VIEKTPIEDEIYYYENIDFFNCSPIEGIKFFVENDDEKLEPIKLLFYNIVGEKKFCRVAIGAVSNRIEIHQKFKFILI